MARTISEFVSQIQKSKGFARPSKFEVVITPPSKILSESDFYWANGSPFQPRSVGFQESRDALHLMKGITPTLTLLCESVSMPGHDLQSHKVQYASEPEVDVVQTHGFAGTIAAVFLLSTDLRERHFFEQWQALAVNRETHKANYYDDYIGEMEIYQLSSDGTKEIRTYGMKVKEAYPTTMTGIEYNNDSTNQIAKMTISFAYKEWKNLGDKDLNLRPY